MGRIRRGFLAFVSRKARLRSSVFQRLVWRSYRTYGTPTPDKRAFRKLAFQSCKKNPSHRSNPKEPFTENGVQQYRATKKGDMTRNNFLAWGLTLVLATLCLALATNGQKTDRPESVWRLTEPVRYENLTIFPVVSSHAVDTTRFATLDDALAVGEVVVTEGGSDVLRRSRNGRPVALPQQLGARVNQLVLINRGSKPLVLLAGELVSGGKQDRIISKDRIVPAGAEPLPLDVFCVEQGRWSSGSQFSAGKLMVHPSVREMAAVDQEQSKVWAAVRSGTTSDAGVAGGLGSGLSAPPPAARLSRQAIGGIANAEAPTQSYARIYESSRVDNSAEPFINEIKRRFARHSGEEKGQAVIGVVVAYGGEVAWSDIFASSGLFERYWPKLLRSYVVEALARPQTKQQASLSDAQTFLQELTGHESIESEPGVYTLRQVTQGRYVEIELEALQPANIRLHALRIHRN